MPGLSVNEEIKSAIQSRNPSRNFLKHLNLYGEDSVFDALDTYLGDLPDGQKIRKITLALNRPETDLRKMAESPKESYRRVSRLILLNNSAGITQDPLLQKGLWDKSAIIRSDSARFTGTGTDRTRLFNQLIKLIREDPSARVRKSAGKRLAESFADLYTVDFNGFPPLSKMLIIDAMGGYTRADEEQVESLMQSKDRETAFRAARTLQKWGTLKRLFNEKNGKGNSILKKAASLGIADYIEDIELNNNNREQAVNLAGQAGRDDLVRLISQAENKPVTAENIIPFTLFDMEEILKKLKTMSSEERSESINQLPVEDQGFRETVEMAFPPPDNDINSRILFEMARSGHWKGWSGRLMKALGSEDPDIRKSAITALADLDPKASVSELPPLLMDNIDRVRRSAACALASIPSGRGCPHLADLLNMETEGEALNAVYDGIRDAGGAALARCILDESVNISMSAAGELLNKGIDEVGVELLADGLTDETEFTALLKNAGYACGKSILKAWPALDENVGKRLLSCLISSNWAESIPDIYDAELIDTFKLLKKEEREKLLTPVLKKTGGSTRRQIRKIMKS